MSIRSGVPDAWDDDWESRVDTTPPPEKKVSSKVTKAQRRAQQAEFNRQLWAEAESPQTLHFVEARSDVPLKQDIKPTVTLLSRRPQLATRYSGVNGATAEMGQLGLEGDSDEEITKAPELTPEERHAIALKNREEKQRKYEEARERLFGSPSATTSGNSTPGTTTPPRQQGEGKGKGKGRGGRDHREKRDPSTASAKSKNLYDPAVAARANGPAHLQRRDRQGERSDSDQQAPQQPIRSPRGPDPSGRGGFGFGDRGARTS